MTRNELVDMILNGTGVIRDFINHDDTRGEGPGTYEDWSDTDVVGHVVGWMNYSIDKLSSLKFGTKQSQEYQGVTTLDEINARIFDSFRGASRPGIESRYLDSLGGYIRIIAAYSEEDVNSDSFDTGFSMAMWRYMLMDTVIHPVQHALYQYLKRENYERVGGALMRVNDLFAAYSNNYAGYRLSEFNVDSDRFRARFMALKEMFPDSHCVAAFVRANLSESV